MLRASPRQYLAQAASTRTPCGWQHSPTWGGSLSPRLKVPSGGPIGKEALSVRLKGFRCEKGDDRLKLLPMNSWPEARYYGSLPSAPAGLASSLLRSRASADLFKEPGL